MTEHEYVSIKQMQGSMSQKSVAEPAAFERANYMKVLGSFQRSPLEHSPRQQKNLRASAEVLLR